MKKISVGMHILFSKITMMNLSPLRRLRSLRFLGHMEKLIVWKELAEDMLNVVEHGELPSMSDDLITRARCGDKLALEKLLFSSFSMWHQIDLGELVMQIPYLVLEFPQSQEN